MQHQPQDFEDLRNLETQIQDIATKTQGNLTQTLALLRCLEQQHRQIRDGQFTQLLPQTRHQLYDLLRDLEEAGGWPYIERMKLHSLLAFLMADSAAEEDGEGRSTEARG